MPESDQRSTVEALGTDPIDAQIRQVFFFDTPDLALNQAGVTVRARRGQRRGDDSVVKLRPVVPAEPPGKLRARRPRDPRPDLRAQPQVLAGGLARKLVAERPPARRALEFFSRRPES